VQLPCLLIYINGLKRICALAGLSKTLAHHRQDQAAREDLDIINDWVRNLRHVPFGGQTHDRYNVDFDIAPHGDNYDDGGC